MASACVSAARPSMGSPPAAVSSPPGAPDPPPDSSAWRYGNDPIRAMLAPPGPQSPAGRASTCHYRRSEDLLPLPAPTPLNLVAASPPTAVSQPTAGAGNAR